MCRECEVLSLDVPIPNEEGVSKNVIFFKKKKIYIFQQFWNIYFENEAIFSTSRIKMLLVLHGQQTIDFSDSPVSGFEYDYANMHTPIRVHCIIVYILVLSPPAVHSHVKIL